VPELLDTYYSPRNISTIKIVIHEKCLENENNKFQKSLSRPSIIDARAHYWAAARRLRSIVLENSTAVGPQSIVDPLLSPDGPNLV
jgi:hypothetical protein